MLTPKEFKTKVVGKSYDIDGTSGVQCVDLFKYFEKLQFGKYHATGTGYAEGYYSKYSTNGLKDYFTKVNFKNVQDGDWVVWGKGAKSCPNSHIAMYYQGKYVSQSAGDKTYYIAINSDGILGCLRYKEYVTSSNPTSSFFPSKGYFEFGDTHANIGKVASFMYKVFPAYTNKKALGNYFGKYIQASIKEFQKRTGITQNGKIDSNTLTKLKKYGFTE